MLENQLLLILKQQSKKKFAENGTTISVLDNDKLLTKFCILFDSENTFALKDGYSKPFVLNENLNQNTKAAIEIVDKNSWKNTIVFSSNLNSIESITVQYTDSAEQNFTIYRGKFRFQIQEIANADSAKISAYLKLYENIAIKRYATTSELYKKDSLLKLKPTFIIKLVDKSEQKSNNIAIFYTNRQNPPIYGLVGLQKELCIIKPRLFEYLLQKRSFFETK